MMFGILHMHRRSRSCGAPGLGALLGLALAVPALATAAEEPAEDPSQIARLESAFRAAPTSQPAAQAFRRGAGAAGALDHAIEVLDEVARSNPDEPVPQLELALALVDQLADPGLDFTRRAVIASQANRPLSAILDRDPTHWAARYARGLTHLLWQRAARHSRAAVEDFARLVSLQSTLPQTSYFVRGHIGLGDAYAMNLQLGLARAAWSTGLEHFPGDPELTRRLAMSNDEIEAFVMATYNFETPFSTDLSFLWSK